MSTLIRVGLCVFSCVSISSGGPFAQALSAQDPATPDPPMAVQEVGPTTSDTLEGIQRVTHILRDHYGSAGRGFGIATSRLDEWDRVDLYRDPYCDGGAGALCHGGDPDRGPCRAGASCHPTTEFLLEVLTEAAVEHPSSGFVVGQAIYALTKFRHTTRALVLADQCQAEEWFCDALHGYVIHAQGRLSEAEPFFRRAMAAAPIPEMCAYGDALWLLGEWSQQFGGIESLPEAREKTTDLPCLDRLEASDTLFWWADPLYAVEGNERWVEHIARALSLRFYEEIERVRSGIPIPQRYVDYDWASRIRRGVWDSYQNTDGRGFSSWTSEEIARYRFIPDVEPGDFSKPTWKLEANLLEEGFTPSYGPFFDIPVQVARFRIGDALMIAVAGALSDTPLEKASNASAHFFLTDGPGSLPLQLTGNAFRATSIFLGQAPSRDYVMSLEVLSSEGIGWHREAVSSLVPLGPELSDLLLFRPSPQAEPDSLLAAVALMLGSNTIHRSGGLGVYWETYGAPQETTLELELALRRDSGGVLNRITRFLPGGPQEGYGPVRWTEETTADTHSGTVSLNLSNLEPGEYDLVLKVRWSGQPVMERRRKVRVEGSG